MRGEDVALNRGEVCEAGSPPHARGRLLIKRLVVMNCRITPACAGKTTE